MIYEALVVPSNKCFEWVRYTLDFSSNNNYFILPLQCDGCLGMNNSRIALVIGEEKGWILNRYCTG